MFQLWEIKVLSIFFWISRSMNKSCKDEMTMAWNHLVIIFYCLNFFSFDIDQTFVSKRRLKCFQKNRSRFTQNKDFFQKWRKNYNKTPKDYLITINSRINSIKPSYLVVKMGHYCIRLNAIQWRVLQIL
jgi:hypothetical protein